MRHAPVLILAIVAIVGVATLMLSMSYVPEPSFMAVQYVSPQPQFPGATGRDTIIVQLEVGEFLGNEVDALSEATLDGLRGGEIHGRDLSTRYTQSLRFTEPGEFAGCRINFGRDEFNRVSDFLECDDSVFKYQILFEPGLRSSTEGGELGDIEDEDLYILGSRFTIVDSDVNTGSKDVELKMFGGLGSVELSDSNYADDEFNQGVRVNGQYIDALVKIKAIDSNDKLTIYSIEYILNANPARGGTLQVIPLHCVREYLQYPLGMLSSTFDICYKGLGGDVALPTSPVGISGNEVLVVPLGDDEYEMVANNLHGRLYDIPLAQLPGSYGIKGRNFVFKEAPNAGAPNIEVGDYFLVTSRNAVNGVSNVLRYDSRSQNTLNFEDLAGGSRKATFDPSTGEGQLLVGEGTYRFVVGAGDALAMDQTNDKDIDGGEANFVLPGGSRIDFGPGFTVRVITPSRLFDEPAGDEVTKFDILFGDNIDLNVPSPQTTVPGYEFKLTSESGGIKQGLTKFGILFTWDQESESDDLRLVVPGAYARRTTGGGALGEVWITTERAVLMRPAPAPTAKCGDGIITNPEYCDPPGSACAGTQPFERGLCADDCMSCVVTPPPVCGNALIERGEECENIADCAPGFGCDNCKCVKLPEPVCGNNLIEMGEQCEVTADCGPGFTCDGCLCLPVPPEVEEPAPVVQPNIFARIWNWFLGLFGWSG